MKQFDDMITLSRDNNRSITINRRDIVLIEPYSNWSKVTVARWQFVYTYNIKETKEQILKMIEEADNK